MPSLVDIPSTTVSHGGSPAIGLDTMESLALGIELKFLVLGMPRDCVLEAQTTSRDQQQRHTYADIARIVGSVSSPSGSITSPQAISRDEISTIGRLERDYWSTHWIVKKANSVEHTQHDPRPDMCRTNGMVVPVEVSSPKLSWTDPPYALFLVQEVVSRIGTLPVTVNHTCDFHVHIGRHDGRAFTLPTLKKLATVFWLAEPVIRSVRNPKSPNFANVYTWGSEQRRYSRLALALDHHSGAVDSTDIAEAILHRVRPGCEGREDLDGDWQQHMASVGVAALRNEALLAIWSAKSSRELGLLLSGPEREHRRLGFNFSAFGEEDERARMNPRTIEFRILEGTLQADLILGWLKICSKLVALGTKGSHAHFCNVVRYLLEKQHVYEDLRMIDYRSRSFGSWHINMRSEQPTNRARPPRDVLFAELMGLIGVEATAYRPFQAKIRQEYGAS